MLTPFELMNGEMTSFVCADIAPRAYELRDTCNMRAGKKIERQNKTLLAAGRNFAARGAPVLSSNHDIICGDFHNPLSCKELKSRLPATALTPRGTRSVIRR